MSPCDDADTHGTRLAVTSFDGMIGQSAAMTAIFRRITLVASLDEPVLVVGETGTGKELVARSIHVRSPRANAPFIAVNCSAVPTTLFEAEFFGYERGAFTDAREAKPGHFEQAHGGTLLLDEVADLPIESQAKLLRVLDQRQVQRLGGRRSIPVNVRIVAATNANLVAAVHIGRFRKDLYWRLNKVCLPLPAVRQRAGDISLLIDAFFELMRINFGRPDLQLSDAARGALLAHAWPGNVREIEHVMHHAVLTAHGAVVELSNLDLVRCGPEIGDRVADAPLSDGMTLKEALANACARLERLWIRMALGDANGNQTQAARRLGIDPRTLRTKMRRYGMQP